MMFQYAKAALREQPAASTSLIQSYTLAKGYRLRPMSMSIRSGFRYAALLAPLFTLATLTVSAQTIVGSEGGGSKHTDVKDAAPLKPPAGQKVAIVEWEDLECPACAHAFPIVHEAANHYHIPIVRYDFPLQMHIWSHEAAVISRYIQDKISPSGAEEYRREVFAKQYQIASKDDLMAFTRKFFSDNHTQYPFVLDPNQQFAKEVDADFALGNKVNLNHTPSIFVVTAKHYWEILDVSQLYSAIDAAQASTAAVVAAPTKHATLGHTVARK